MNSLRSIYPFPVNEDYRFRFRGRVCRFTADNVRALKLLAGIVVSADPADRYWLLRRRGDVREILRLEAIVPLLHAIERPNSLVTLILAIWLRGRCRGTVGAGIVQVHARSPHRALRKHSVRCLKRLSAWSALRAIERIESDPQIRRIAAQPRVRPYAGRLKDFARHMTERPASFPHGELYLAPGVNLAQRNPPKPLWLIRMILERLHTLVRRT